MNQITNQKEWLVIVNPNAGKGKGHKDWNIIAGFLKKAHIILYSQSLLKQKGMLSGSHRKPYKDGCRNIITVGGDGTLNEVVNGIFTRRQLPFNRYFSCPYSGWYRK